MYLYSLLYKPGGLDGTEFPTTLILVAIQEGLATAQEARRKKQACQDSRSTMGWTTEQEESWQSMLNSSRNGNAVWIGASCSTVEADEGGRSNDGTSD